MLLFFGAEVQQSWAGEGAVVQRSRFIGAMQQRCRGAEVQIWRCRVIRCRGSAEEVIAVEQVHRCSKRAEVQQRCRGADMEVLSE